MIDGRWNLSRMDVGPVLNIHVKLMAVGYWRQMAEEAARSLYDRFPILRTAFDPGRLVTFQFDVEDFREELREAAIAAFNDEWSRLVPGWSPPDVAPV